MADIFKVPITNLGIAKETTYGRPDGGYLVPERFQREFMGWFDDFDFDSGDVDSDDMAEAEERYRRSTCVP
jgi:hypothetical protein